MGTDVYVVGIAGGTGSGKTALTRALHGRFAGDSSLISHDNYYKRRDELSYEQRTKLNYDHPSAFDNDLLVEHLDELLGGRGVDIPVYDFAVHNRSAEALRVAPRRILFLEGLLLLDDARLRERCDLRIYVDTDADVRILRRVKRDVVERGRTIESVERQYLATVKPMHEQYVEATKQYADLVVPEGGYNERAIEIIAGGLAAVIARESDTAPSG
ncbi:MAG: uridine kinase [Microbacteriaceae bacterium]|nr:uridine kinase [Microbacteriaceae bacterium]